MGCSSLTLSTKDQRHFLARTMDFTMDPGSCLLNLPRGQSLRLCQGENPITLQYAMLGMGTRDESHRTLYDGVNEKGLLGAVLYYPGAVYSSRHDARGVPVNPMSALLYLLGSCGSLAEVKALGGRITLLDEGNDILGQAPPLHFIFSDQSGETLIMEPDAGGMSFYDDNVGVLTNAPAYPWHETNLRNYIGMEPNPAVPGNVCSKALRPFGQGSGTWGLPGDYTGPSRFVRTAYMKTNAKQGQTELEGMNQCMHILSSVNIPLGAVVNQDGRPDFTRYTCAICAESRTYYFTTYDCRRIHAATLTESACKGPGVVLYDWPGDPDIRYL